MSAAGGVPLAKCLVCHVRFAPIDGPCPKCGSASTEPYVSAGLGVVLAATALEVPPPGWERPHPLALVEVEDGVRLLAIAELPLPDVGTAVAVRLDRGRYRATPSHEDQGERGEGDVPKAGSARPPFEPPR